MMRGGVRLSTFPSHVSIHYPLHATWHLHPATMHGGVQFNYPAMHGGGAKRASFKKIQIRVKSKICFKFELKIKKNPC
jgi:hypothetical protein